jgi:hypothetical protein
MTHHDVITPPPQDLHDLVASRRALAASQGGADAGGDEGVDEEEEEGLEEGDEEDEEAAADARCVFGGGGRACAPLCWAPGLEGCVMGVSAGGASQSWSVD